MGTPSKRLIYNGHTFPFSRLEVSEALRMSEDGLSPVGSQYRFTISGWITANTTSDMQTALYTMRAKLSQPRRSFAVQYSEDGSTWSDFYSFPTTGDDGWGPFPGELWLKQFSGGRAAQYSWSVEVFKKQCWDASSLPVDAQSNILSRTQEWTHAVDECGYTTRTVSGVLRLKRAAGSWADQYRTWVSPTIPAWFKREPSTFTQSPDGLSLNYSITDREVHWTLPKPVMKGHATYSVKLAPQNGLMVTHTLSGEFAGGSSVDKSAIMQAVFDLVEAKFPDYASDAVPTFLFQDLSFSESVYDNAVSFSISGEVAGGGQEDLNAAMLRFYVPPPGVTNEGLSQQPNDYGSTGNGNSSGVMAGEPVTYDAAGTATGPDDPGTVHPGADGVPSQETQSVPGENTPTPYPPATSADHEKRPYLEYRETLDFHVDQKIVTFAPKSDNSSARPFFQRTATPVLTIIQAGYWIRATRDNIPFQQPKPYGWNQVGGDGLPMFIVLDATFQPQNAEPMGAGGWYQVTAHWRYVIRASYRLDDDLTGTMFFPGDPRLADPIQPNAASNVDENATKHFHFVERFGRS